MTPNYWKARRQNIKKDTFQDGVVVVVVVVDKVSGTSTTEVIGTHSNNIVSDVFF